MEKMAKIRASYDVLAHGLERDPLWIIYGSDGGNARSVANMLASKAEAAFPVVCKNAEEVACSELGTVKTKVVVFVLSTAGQGEVTADAERLYREILAESSVDLSFAVFGLGDSAYWGEGTEESSKFFCLPARDLDKHLECIGGERLLDLGLGDDHHIEGYSAALDEWEAKLWERLDVVPSEILKPPRMDDESIKKDSNHLRGTIKEGLADLSTSKMLLEDVKIMKFHGIYQQDHRDKRRELDKLGKERAFSFMIRIGLPGGLGSARQYCAMDDISSKFTDGSLKLTTRQAYQLHGILKKDLKNVVQEVNKVKLSSLAACGDVNRNVIATTSREHAETVQGLARSISNRLMPKTNAYSEVWLDGEKKKDEEPLYGSSYLPRKFKIAIAVPPRNDVDVFAHCCGFIAIVEDGGGLEGWNVTVGGGMGRSHGNKDTYPKAASLLGFCKTGQVTDVAEKVMLVQRDFGDRENRKRARLKYTLEKMGMERFKSELESRLGYELERPRPFLFTTSSDSYGWHRGKRKGRWDYTLFVENGVVKDLPEFPIKTVLRAVAERLTEEDGEMRITALQNIVVGNVPKSLISEVSKILKPITRDSISGFRRNSLACVALPTCGLALAESQTYLPSLLTKIEATLSELSLWRLKTVVRMSGCPNGCSRPYLAEIGLVGRAPGRYDLYLGGAANGSRLNTLYKEGLEEKDILSELRELLVDYSKSSRGQSFGDWYSVRLTATHLAS